MKVLRTYKLKITSDHPKFGQYAESLQESCKLAVLCSFQTQENQHPESNKQRARNNRWPYFMLEFFVTYKANFVRITVDNVPAKNTSRGCKFTDNADRVGAKNVALRSLLQRC